MTKIFLKIDGDPIAKKRPRFCVRAGFAKAYDIQGTEIDTFQARVKKQYWEEPIDSPISIKLKYFMPMPKSWSKKRKLEKESQVHDSKPDCDNLIKFTTDCLNGLVYRDDALIYEIYAIKVYSSEPRTEIEINTFANTIL
jgi:Holliday junction resolvase RusA-like endonuclease